MKIEFNVIQMPDRQCLCFPPSSIRKNKLENANKRIVIFFVLARLIRPDVCLSSDSDTSIILESEFHTFVLTIYMSLFGSCWERKCVVLLWMNCILISLFGVGSKCNLFYSQASLRLTILQQVREMMLVDNVLSF